MPGSPSYVIDEAKARQGVPLLEVQEPAIQSPPIDINLDYNTITAKVKESLVKDNGFSTVMAKSVSNSASDLVDNKLNTFRTEIDTKLSAQSRELLNKLDAKIESNNVELKKLFMSDTTYQSQIDSINNKIINMNSNLEKYAARVKDPSNYSVDITDYIPQIVDAILPQVVEKVLLTVDDNKSILFSDIYAEVGNDELTDEQFEAVYNNYRSSIVIDITNEILDDIEAKVSNEIDEKLLAQAALTKTTTPPVEETVAPEEETVTPVEDKTEPVEEVSATTDDSSNYIKSNTISIVAVSDGSNIQKSNKDLTKKVEVPEFAKTPSVTVLDPAEYDSQRAVIREKAINDILKMIE